MKNCEALADALDWLFFGLNTGQEFAGRIRVLTTIGSGWSGIEPAKVVRGPDTGPRT